MTDDFEARQAAAVERAGEQIRWYTKNSVWSGILYRVFQPPFPNCLRKTF